MKTTLFFVGLLFLTSCSFEVTFEGEELPITITIDTASLENIFSELQGTIVENAENGDPESMADLGIMYYRGSMIDTGQDNELALEWLNKAEEAGSARALLFLGIIYKEGEAVGQDYQAAKEYFERAIEAEETDAYYELGLLYQQGLGVAADLDKARMYLELGCEAGHEESCLELENA